MANKFAGFTPEQIGRIVPETQGMQSDEIAKFLGANPAAASRIGMATAKAEQMLNGDIPTQGYARGGIPFSGPIFAALRKKAAKTSSNVTNVRKLNEAAINTPEKMVTTQDVYQIGGPQANELISKKAITTPKNVGRIGTATATTARDVAAPTTPDTVTYDAVSATPDVQQSLQGMQAAQLEGLTQEAQAAQGQVSQEALAAEDVQMDADRIQQVQAQERAVTQDELVEAKGKNLEAIQTQVAQSDALVQAVAEQGVVQPNEIPVAATIAESDMAQAEAITAKGLAPDAVAVAAKLDKFSVDEGTLAEFKEGKVEAQETVQGQLTALMRDFDDGTPAWAAGAIRAANAAMASRGLGGSSMAGSAVLQAAMESAIPIAKSDADTFARMKLDNLSRQQQISLANAAAQQGVELANFNAEQQAALQNSQNAFSLQTQNLSNMQQAVIANAQIKASLQGQNLSNQQQVNIATAARYAEQANINLNNRQQTALVNSQNNLQTNLANLDAKQQAYVTNANLAAALQGKVLDNEQQTAILNAAKFSEASNITFNAEQQAQLHNSSLMQTIGLAEMNAQQAAVLQNAATFAAMDQANLNNRQQAMVQNAKAFLELDMANLNNEQQTAMLKQQQITQALLSDQAAENAARQFNATSENQTNQFFADLSTSVAMSNQVQRNTMARFNAGEKNAIETMLFQEQNRREEFNATAALEIEQANTRWAQEITTRDNATLNQAARDAAIAANEFTMTGYNNEVQGMRDMIDYAWRSSENARDRENRLLLQNMTNEAAAARSAGQGMGTLVNTALNAYLNYKFKKP